VFADVDPAETAALLLTMVDGAVLEKTTRTDDPMGRLVENILGYIDDRIVADE